MFLPSEPSETRNKRFGVPDSCRNSHSGDLGDLDLYLLFASHDGDALPQLAAAAFLYIVAVKPPSGFGIGTSLKSTQKNFDPIRHILMAFPGKP